MPSEVVQFLSLDEAIAIHERLNEKFGGIPGIRDRGMLESALFRPRTGYYEGLSGMAAALFESLINNHTFFDGNKRIAFFSCDVFLRLNGWKLRVDPSNGYNFIVGSLDRGGCDFDHVLPWIARHLERL